MTPISDIRCDLGEGPLWHPERGELFWFDITGRRLHSRARSWVLDEMASAAGWVDRDRLLVATESRLMLLDLTGGARQTLCALDAEVPGTRSNDGRADPQGGFWIGTMGKTAQPGAGAIWRWYRGTLRCLYPGLSIPNAICFAPDGRSACFTDTPTRRVMRVALDDHGWPSGRPDCWLDLTGDALNPDGAVMDAHGNLWLALWGAGKILCHAPDGTVVHEMAVPAVNSTCPAFGGADLRRLYCTSAREQIARPAPLDGATFAASAPVRGQAEHRVRLADEI